MKSFLIKKEFKNVCGDKPFFNLASEDCFVASSRHYRVMSNRFNINDRYTEVELC
jgi:hypothetical protein